MKNNHPLIPAKRIEQIIYFIRDQRVMLDEDLATLYGVETKALNRAVKRNFQRFPLDFSFVLTQKEWGNLKCQFGASSSWGGRRKLPLAFTEHGAAMLANVLRGERAALISIEIVRAFIRLRRALAGQKELGKEVAELKSFALKHAQKSDQEFRKVWRAIDKLAPPPPPEPPRRIGFQLD